MLTTLRIQNLAIVEQLSVDFTGGLNVLTGETGAGKSILVDALQLVLGGRFSADSLRAGSDEGSVEALFEGPGLEARLEALGLPTGEGECLVRRTVGRTSKGRVFINGSLSTVAILQQLSKGLVDLSGQHDQVTLLDPRTHLPQLDAFAGAEPLVGEYRAQWSDLRQLKADLFAVETSDKARAGRIELATFQIRELEALSAAPGEEQALGTERRKLTSAARLAELSLAADEQLSGDGGARDLAASVLSRLREAAAIDPSISEISKMVEAAVAELDEAGRDLRGRAGAYEDPARLQEVEERLEAIRAVARKHGVASDQLASVREALSQELSGLQAQASERSRLEVAVAAGQARAREMALKLREVRARACRRFANLMVTELTRLAMGRTRVSFELGEGEAGPTGMDQGQLLISPNPGEPLRPLVDIASGGELSRILLALKRVLARSDAGRTHVFDEIDAGIGGAAAEAVGQMLSEVAKGTQVICITHLPQIAAYADHHLEVSKDVHRGRTVSSVRALTDAERQREVARMLAGSNVSSLTLECAGELLRKRSPRSRRVQRAAT